MAAERKEKTLVVALDAVSAEFFNPMYDSGELPHFKDFFSDGLRVRACIGVFPTVSPCNHGLITYGLGPGESNLVGLSWYNKQTHSYFNELTLSGILSDLNKGIPSKNIFESTRHTLAFGPQLTRGSRTVLPIYATFAFGMANWATRIESAFIRNLHLSFAIYDNVYFGSLSSDHVGHAFGLEGVQQNLRSLDAAFGELFEKLAPETNVIIFSDHGSSPIDSGKAIHISEIMRDAGFRQTKRLRDKNEYVLCTTVVTYAHAYTLGPARDMADALKVPDGVDFVMYRDTSRDAIIVENREGRAELRRDGNLYMYLPLSADPLGYEKADGAIGEWLTLLGWAERTYCEKYPAAPPRIVDLFDSPNTGDVVVNFGGGHYPYYAGITQKFTHGSLLRNDIMVPVLARGPGIKKGVRDWGVHEQLHTLIRTCVGGPPRTDAGITMKKRLSSDARREKKMLEFFNRASYTPWN
jgi:hypothetical protein